MDITEALIDRFFNGACSSEEAEAVLSYLKSNPAAEEKYIGKKEWDEALALESRLSAVQSARMLKHIQSSLVPKQPRKLISSFIAVAASLILIGGTFLFRSNDKVNLPEIVHVEYQEAWKVIGNTGQGIKRFALEDGSFVELDPNSEISVPAQFRKNSREVKLTGRAFFSVLKDKKRPFTVFADNTSTTALGTKFIIDAGEGSQTTAIQLLEGKVLIKVSNKTTKTILHHYLTPGQELIYAKGSSKITVQSASKNSTALSKLDDKHVMIRTRTKGNQISFSRVPVSTVFRELEAAFEVQINFPDTGLGDNYFTGSFHADDSLERILQVIGKTNNLEVERDRSGYQISKRKNKFHQ